MARLNDTALLRNVDFDTLRDAVLAEARTYGLELLRDGADGACVRWTEGCVEFTRHDSGCMAQVSAERADLLQTMRDGVVAHVAARAPEAALALRWSGQDAAGALPANARVMRVESVERLDCGFTRIALRGDVSRFSNTAIHFRLGLPPEGRTPVWPTVGSNGATVWPKGEDALHLPVYTALEAEGDRLVFDIFRHEGGRATAWADGAPVGSQVVVVGPGGGGCEIEGAIIAHADDTAFPAIARILAACPDLSGTVHLYPSTDAAARYPFPPHDGVTLMRHQGKRDRMASAACDVIRTDRHAWFAGERRQAERVRKAWKTAGGSARQSYIAAFWQ
ncbi:siderophore-interacting protein [Sulfitobacter sp. LCG007]